MTRRATLLLAIAATCASAPAAAEGPRLYPSAKPRAVIVECLMNRLAGGDLRVRQQVEGDATIVTARLPMIGMTYFAFAVRDSGTGSVTAMRRANRIAPGLGNALTCF